MKKITQDDIQSHYKEAIREKYRVEKNEGKYSNYLSNPSQAVLRDLCWEIFNSEPKVDDIAIYRNFFKADFIPKEVDTSQQYTDKFKKVGAFFKAERETAKISTVELAAILVDFQPRPFNKFRKEIDPENRKLIEELRNPDFTKNDFFSDGLINEVENENFPDLKNEESEKDKNEEVKQDVAEEVQEDEDKESETTTEVMHTFVATGQPPKFQIKRYLVAATFLAGLAIFIYLSMSKKDCMQWSGDHYERVSCDLDVNGLGSFNVVEPFDKTVFDLKKIKVCDTTPFFDKNGKAIVWYGKTANGIDFFNGHGRHPENNGSLKPVTRYILNKYVKK
ncbi:MAG: hypothetical protein J7574_07540 [Flavobacterium sp.]|uniref:hypothetical protein n=1 Tax=Flavobacterium sp. TaxID=239 RepID=UPI001B10C06D|nr:hypothetical protein [Flavobacterium sp.]MBO9583995.1 hypothetical protein [Flavobacterium sp.]